jgi:hypothetical protein
MLVELAHSNAATTAKTMLEQMTLFEMNVPPAADFAGLPWEPMGTDVFAAIGFDTAEPLAMRAGMLEAAAVAVAFWKRMWGASVGLGRSDVVVLTTDEVDRILLEELDVLELELELELEELEVEVLDGVGVDDEVELVVEVDDGVGVDDEVELVVEVDDGVGVDDEVELVVEVDDGVGEGEDEGEAEPELESPAEKTTTLAVMPLGTVTTQKLAPPAPDA